MRTETKKDLGHFAIVVRPKRKGMLVAATPVKRKAIQVKPYNPAQANVEVMEIKPIVKKRSPIAQLLRSRI